MRKPVGDVGADAAVVKQRSAEISLQRVAKPMQVLLMQRPVETELRLDPRDRLGGTVVACDRFGCAPWNDLHQREDQDAAEQRRRDQDQQAAEEDAQHRGPLSEAQISFGRLTSSQSVL